MHVEQIQESHFHRIEQTKNANTNIFSRDIIFPESKNNTDNITEGLGHDGNRLLQ